MTVAAKHGRFDVAVVESAAVRVAVVPEYGAKVIELVDRRTGRNWLTTGAPANDGADPAVFGGRQSYGWDECFPTIGIRDAAMPGWDDAPRDHGMMWGRPWRAETTVDSLTTTFEHRDCVFTRRLRVADATVTAEYALENRSGVAKPYLWSAHPTFAFLPGETIALPRIEQLAATYARVEGRTLAEPWLTWPVATVHGRSERLDVVRGMDARMALKLYATGAAPDHVAVDGSAGRLIMRYQRPAITTFGLWLDYGGWPDDQPIHQVALEPTTSPDDDIWSAMENGRAATLPANGRVEWSMTIALEPPPSNRSSDSNAGAASR